jgi:hypothetical protein
MSLLISLSISEQKSIVSRDVAVFNQVYHCNRNVIVEHSFLLGGDFLDFFNALSILFGYSSQSHFQYLFVRIRFQTRFGH